MCPLKWSTPEQIPAPTSNCFYIRHTIAGGITVISGKLEHPIPILRSNPDLNNHRFDPRSLQLTAV